MPAGTSSIAHRYSLRRCCGLSGFLLTAGEKAVGLSVLITATLPISAQLASLFNNDGRQIGGRRRRTGRRANTRSSGGARRGQQKRRGCLLALDFPGQPSGGAGIRLERSERALNRRLSQPWSARPRLRPDLELSSRYPHACSGSPRGSGCPKASPPRYPLRLPAPPPGRSLQATAHCGSVPYRFRLESGVP